MSDDTTSEPAIDLSGRIGVRTAARHITSAFALAWQAAPVALVVRLALTPFSAAIPIAVAWLTKTVLDQLAAPGSVELSAILVPGLVLAGIGVAGGVLGQVSVYMQGQMSRAIELAARERLYRKVVSFDSLARFENPRFHDRLQLAGTAATMGPNQLFEHSVHLVQGCIAVGGFIGTLLLLNPWMVLVVAVSAVPSLRAELKLSRLRARMVNEVGQATRREMFYADLLTSATAAKEIRLYGLSDLFGARMVAELRRINGHHKQMDRRELLVQGLLGLMGAAVAGTGLVWAILAARSGQLSVGDVSVFIAAVAGVQVGLMQVVSSVSGVHHSALMFGHYRYIVDLGPDMPPPQRELLTVPQMRECIELRNVWFRYGDDLPWILRGVSLTLPSKQATAFVGLNGAGKSTLVKLLCRFYDPTKGSVLWDGTDIRMFPVAELRRRVRAVFQDFMSYDLTAGENIGLGDVLALEDRSRIDLAASKADCRDLIEALPSGYDTMLSRLFFDNSDKDDASTGVVLSGGQWQRLAIARALMRDDPDLLILDEPSAGLDPEAEYQLHQRLRNFRRGQTAVIIGHRLGAIRDADNIVVLAGGVVAEQGTHSELLGKNGAYARLFKLQASGYSDELPQDRASVEI
ncbi:ABC transporter ATP-binding protein [Micromonospora sp. NPDC048842]|uniref:ABC transporter ATP-binding protein n=1 Tax=Micromonospora sp. NPDC048842 TaxID=3154346 RepID=UPI0033F9E17D